MENIEMFEKGKLLKDALKIIDELTKLDVDVIDGDTPTLEDFDVDKFEEIYIKAKELTRNRWWKLI